MKRLILLAALAVAACGQAQAPPPAAPAGQRLYARIEAFSGSFIEAYDASSGRLLVSVPDGPVAPDWSRAYSTRAEAGDTLVTVSNPATGAVERRLRAPAGFHFARDAEQLPLGLSPSGHRLVLESNDAATPRTSSFWVLDTATGASRTITLPGHTEFDAISDDGARLYYIDWLDAPGKYSVRAYDLDLGEPLPGTVADKTEPQRTMMAGVRHGSVTNGAWQFTVYQGGPTGAFIHALNLRLPIAWCIDLPPGPGTGWRLALSPDGATLYAIDSWMRTLVEIGAGSPDGAEPPVRRTVTIDYRTPSSRLPFVEDVAAKEAGGGAVAVTRDGSTIYAALNTGLLAIDTRTLTVRRGRALDTYVMSLALAPNGRSLYLLEPGGRVFVLDPNLDLDSDARARALQLSTATSSLLAVR